MAAILAIDTSSAKRFVSSLSKSLQALCHGCMDFDTQIEIIGYLNVNIDCNGKVDCVLNEKVSKSEDNSMTFTSNSFLAKKDEPKSLSERSCSPIAELNTISHYQGKDGAYSNSSSQHYRSSGIFSPHSQIVRSAQKRPWRGSGWRDPQRHVKSARFHEPRPNQSFLEGPSQQDTSLSDTSAPNTHFDVSNSNPSQTDVCIKNENPESLPDPSHPNTSSCDNQTTDTTNINIKPDPDSADTTQSQSNFLQIPADQNSGEQSFFKTEPVSTEGQNPESGTVEQNAEGDEGNEGFSGVQADYDESEAQSYNQSIFGDESGDASQFDYDVIEINDEDEEDMEQFEGEAWRSITEPKHVTHGRQPSTVTQHGGLTITDIRTAENHAENSKEQKVDFRMDGKTGRVTCPDCKKGFSSLGNAVRHYRTNHQEVFLYKCVDCGKGFANKSDFEGHLVSHGRPMTIECPHCGKMYAYKASLKYHIKREHGDKNTY